MIIDYFTGGDMSALLDKEEELPESDVRFYLSEIVLAIEKLHEMGVIHRDIKPANILIDRDGHIAVVDYGLCKILSPRRQAVDWWSVGIVAFKMLTGVTPFQGPDLENQILYQTPNWPHVISQELKSLMEGLLNKEPWLYTQTLNTTEL
jgi:serine/threonine protein kinase